MPQIFRILPEEGVLHILTRGNNRQKVFEDNHDYKTYLKFIKIYKQENKISIYHYCVMPNHVHLIVAITQDSELSKFMKQLNLAYLHHHKKRYGYLGHLWQGRYKSLIISEDEYLITCGRYIELNPVKAGIVKDPKEYEYSSYNAYAYGRKDEIVEYSPMYLELGKTTKERKQNYRHDIKGELYKDKVNLSARFIGPDTFVKEMENKFQVSNVRLKKGRPQKNNI